MVRLAKILKYNPTGCYHCGKEISTVQEHVIKPVQLDAKGGAKLVNRDFHISCVRDFQSSYELEKEEQTEDYWFRKSHDKIEDLIGVSGGYLVTRLRGLRINKYSAKGENAIATNRGYSYESIYNTILFCTPEIQNAVRTRAFKDDNHLVNFVMYLLRNKVAFINKKTKNQKSTSEALERTFEKVVVQSDEEYMEFEPVKDDKGELLREVLNKEDKEDDGLDFDKLFR